MKITSVEPIKPSILKLTFDRKEIKYFDMSPYWHSSFFKELQDWEYFKLVKVAGKTIAWPHEQDIAPETLYMESRTEMPEESFRNRSNKEI